MLPLVLYLALLAAASAYALIDWRRGWLLVALCGVLQDPVRKLTSGTPVYVSFAVVALYGAILFGARYELSRHLGDFSRRFANIFTACFAFFVLLVIAGMNGLVTYGFDKWKVPLVSLFTYCVPLIAAILGYAWLQREEMMYRWFRFYAALTSVALIGTLLEWMRVPSRILGLVAFEGDYIRHLPGIQIRLLSGIYRGPDIMSWHAAMLTSIAMAMALRTGRGRHLVIWGSIAGWGFFNCIIAGRRKAIYFVVVFALAFLWRYFGRVRNTQVVALIGVLLVLGGVVRQIARGQETSIYARAAATTQSEITARLEGGALETLKQFGLMGAGLGTATQGVYHLLGENAIGWQEGGLGKLAIEVGLPGILAILVIGWMTLRVLLRLTRVPDVRGSSQFLRAMLFGLAAANISSFLASAQAFTDAVLGLTAGFLVGCLFATAALDEKLVQSDEQPQTAPLSPLPAPL